MNGAEALVGLVVIMVAVDALGQVPPEDQPMTEETNRCHKCGGEGIPIIYGLVPFIPGGPRPEIFKALRPRRTCSGRLLCRSMEPSMALQEVQPAFW